VNLQSSAEAGKLWEEPVPWGVCREVSLVSGHVGTATAVRTNSSSLSQRAGTMNMRWTVNAPCNSNAKPSSSLLPRERCSLHAKKKKSYRPFINQVARALLFTSADLQQQRQTSGDVAGDGPWPGRSREAEPCDRRWSFSAFCSAARCPSLPWGWIAEIIFHNALRSVACRDLLKAQHASLPSAAADTQLATAAVRGNRTRSC